MMWWFLWMAVALGGAFDDGLSAFDQGHLDDAVVAWESVDGGGSTAMHYNAGVARYRADDLARAIAHWRRARQLAPRNGDIVHNLAMARSRTGGKTSDPVGAQRTWMAFLTPGELGGLGLLLVLFGSAGAVAWRRERLDSPVAPAAMFVVGLLATLLAAGGADAIARSPIVVVVDTPAVVRDAAAVEASEVFELAPGSEVRVDERLGDFLLVRTGDGRGGWIPASSAIVVGPG